MISGTPCNKTLGPLEFLSNMQNDMEDHLKIIPNWAQVLFYRAELSYWDGDYGDCGGDCGGDCDEDWDGGWDGDYGDCGGSRSGMR